MSFTCYPIIITKVEGKELPSPKEVIDNLLYNSEIAINVLTDKNSKLFKEIVEYNELNIEVEYIIVVLKYLKEFNA